MAEFISFFPWFVVLLQSVAWFALVWKLVGTLNEALTRATPSVPVPAIPAASVPHVQPAAPIPAPILPAAPAPPSVPAKPAGPFPGAPPWFLAALPEIGFHETGNNMGLDRYIQMAHCGANGEPWCFTGETQILTAEGFVRLDTLTGEEDIYQADDFGRLSLTKGQPISKDYDGDVFDIDHRSLKLTCDVGHRWFGYWHQEATEPKFQSLEKLTTSALRIPTVKSSQLDAPYSDEDITLLAAFISDGKHRKSKAGNLIAIEFEVSRPRKIAALSILQPSNVYVQKRAYGPLTKTPLTVFTFQFPSFFNDVFSDYKKLDRKFINSLSRRQAELFLRAYAKFDGNDGNKLYTSSPCMKDDLITIAVFAGFYPCVYETSSPLSGRPTWMISFGLTTKGILPKQVTRRHFFGKLYCVSVPMQRIIVRGENGCPVMTGNCAIFANAMLETSGIQGTRSPSSQSFRTNPNFVQLSGPALGAIVVYWRISQSSGQGHVGFYRGEDASRIWTLGGNENDMVQIEALPKDSASFGLIGYWWPRSVPLPVIAPVLMPVGSPVQVQTPPTGTIAPKSNPNIPSNQTGITATYFGGQKSAYGGPIIDDQPGVALPFRFPGTRQKVRVTGQSSGKSVDCDIVDVGPWNTNDPYWTTGARPQAETGTDMTGRHTNKAGIDLTLAAANAIGIDGKGIVAWQFIGGPVSPPNVV